MLNLKKMNWPAIGALAGIMGVIITLVFHLRGCINESDSESAYTLKVNVMNPDGKPNNNVNLTTSFGPGIAYKEGNGSFV